MKTGQPTHHEEEHEMIRYWDEIHPGVEAKVARCIHPYVDLEMHGIPAGDDYDPWLGSVIDAVLRADPFTSEERNQIMRYALGRYIERCIEKQFKSARSG
jgi:hypothetical protein